MSTKLRTRRGGRPTHSPPVIFISYRREETQEFTALLKVKLESHFGRRAHVFWDHGAIEAGDDFPRKIRETIESCAVMVAVIGGRWLEVRDEKTGRRRLEGEKDFVRLEIASALSQGVTVIPVLVKGARQLDAEDLPDDLKPLADRHYLVLRGVEYFDREVGDLIAALEKRLPKVKEWRPDEHEFMKLLDRQAGQTLTGPEEMFGSTSQTPPVWAVSLGVVGAFVLLLTLMFSYC